MQFSANLKEEFAGLKEFWSPKIIGETGDQQIKIVKLKGMFVWHTHEHEDESFYVIKGTLRLEMEDKYVLVKEGEYYKVPKKVRHNPVAEDECWVVLVEPKTLKYSDEVIAKFRKSRNKGHWSQN